TEAVNRNNEKIYAMKENACMSSTSFVTGIDVNHNIEVVPNPTSGDVHVKFYLPTAEPCTLQLFNELGQMVYSETYNNGLLYNNDIDLNYLPTGTYNLKVSGSNINASQKVVVIR